MAKPIDRGNGHWDLRARIRTVNGRPEYLYGRFKGGSRAAQKAQNKLEDEAVKERARREAIERGEQVTEDSGELTVADALEGFWKDHGAKVDSPDTIRDHIDLYLKPGLGAVELKRLRGQLTERAARLNPHLVSLSDWYADLKQVRDPAKPVAPSYAARIHATLRSSLQYAVREGWLEQNPASDAKLPKVTKRRSTTPEPADLVQFLDRIAETHPRLYTFVMLVGSGVRPVEGYALRWRDFDLETGMLHTSGDGLVRTRGGNRGTVRYELREGETAKRRSRDIALDPVAMAAVRAHRKWALEYAMAAGVRLRPDAFVFSLKPDGGAPQEGSWATQGWHRRREQAIKDGLTIPKSVRQYDVRHYLATAALAAGHSPTDIAERMGNSHATVTRFYGHGTRAGDKAIAASMGEAWGVR